MQWAMDELEARAHAQLNALRDYSERLADIRIRAGSNGGLATAEVDGVGALVGLEFSADATAAGGRQLGAAVVAAATLAGQRAFAARAALTEEFRASFADMTDSAVATGSGTAADSERPQTG